MTLVNICDVELIGKTVKEGKLSVHISNEYFAGEVVQTEEALRLMRVCAIVSLAGKRTVDLALANKLAAQEAVRELEGVPFLMIYKFPC
jgi:hypothetical protein